MSVRAEHILLAGLCAVLLLGYLAAGILFAQLVGLAEYGLAWGIVVLAWPFAVGFGLLVAWLALWLAAGVVKVVRG